MFPLAYGQVYKEPSGYHPPEDSKDLVGNTQYPNQNSKDYADRAVNHTPIMDTAWECIAMNEHGHAVIGTNKLDGREWYATCWGFEQLEELTVNKSCFKLRLNGLLNALKYVSNDLYILALQSGHVQVWSTTVRRVKDTMYCPFKIGDKCEHLTPISCLDVINSIAATGSKDGTLKIWDMGTADLYSTHTFNYAHVDNLTGVAFELENEALLATSSYDRSVLLWDLRKTRPAHALFEDHMVGFKTLAWNTAGEATLLYVGDETGAVHTIDKRVPKKFVTSINWLDDPVRKIIPQRKNVAVIGDNKVVKILVDKELNEHSKIESDDFYENTESTGFIRDGVWVNDKEFLSVGFDGKLRRHDLTKKNC